MSNDYGSLLADVQSLQSDLVQLGKQVDEAIPRAVQLANEAEIEVLRKKIAELPAEK